MDNCKTSETNVFKQMEKTTSYRPQSEIDPKDFSIILGGPFFQLLRKAHLSGNALELVKKRTLIISLLAWLPLFLLSLLEGTAWGEAIVLPFIKDIEVQVRFLIALPIMVVAELMVHERMRIVVNQFLERELIPELEKPKFIKAIESAYRLRNSFAVELFIVVLIYVIGYNVVWEKSIAVDATAWFTENGQGERGLSMAGMWFRYFSLPVFQFLFLRWYFRIFIWARFLFQISKIKLRLSPMHPDYLGGLGFISNIVFAFMPLAIMHGVVLAGSIANHIFREGTTLLDYKYEIIVITLIVLFLVVVPLLAFSSQLAEVKRQGNRTYGKLAIQYGHDFDTKWINNDQQPTETLLGNHDIQALSDLQNAFKIIRDMRMVPISRNDIVMLVAATIAPVLPLLLTMMPLNEIIQMAAGILF